MGFFSDISINVSEVSLIHRQMELVRMPVSGDTSVYVRQDNGPIIGPFQISVCKMFLSYVKGSFEHTK